MRVNPINREENSYMVKRGMCAKNCCCPSKWMTCSPGSKGTRDRWTSEKAENPWERRPSIYSQYNNIYTLASRSDPDRPLLARSHVRTSQRRAKDALVWKIPQYGQNTQFGYLQTCMSSYGALVLDCWKVSRYRVLGSWCWFVIQYITLIIKQTFQVIII